MRYIPIALHRSPLAARVICVLRAYLDASGVGESGISGVAGYIAFVDEWTRLEKVWSEALGKVKLEYFHFNDVVHQLGVDKAETFIAEMECIVQEAKLHAIGVALVDDHWKQNDWGDIQTPRLNSPYEQCLDMAFDLIKKCVSKHYPEQEADVFCCRDASGEKIGAIYDKHEAGSSIFTGLFIGSSKKYPPLQCADLAAGKLRKSWIEIGYQNSQDPWGSMPSSKGYEGMVSFWSLIPHELIGRAIALRQQQTR